MVKDAGFHNPVGVFHRKTVNKYEELTFADDFMFCKVLTDRPDLCRELVEIITGRKVKEIRNLVAQMSEKEYYDGTLGRKR